MLAVAMDILQKFFNRSFTLCQCITCMKRQNVACSTISYRFHPDDISQMNIMPEIHLERAELIRFNPVYTPVPKRMTCNIFGVIRQERRTKFEHFRNKTAGRKVIAE